MTQLLKKGIDETHLKKLPFIAGGSSGAGGQQKLHLLPYQKRRKTVDDKQARHKLEVA